MLLSINGILRLVDTTSWPSQHNHTHTHTRGEVLIFSTHCFKLGPRASFFFNFFFFCFFSGDSPDSCCGCCCIFHYAEQQGQNSAEPLTWSWQMLAQNSPPPCWKSRPPPAFICSAGTAAKNGHGWRRSWKSWRESFVWRNWRNDKSKHVARHGCAVK